MPSSARRRGGRVRNAKAPKPGEGVTTVGAYVPDDALVLTSASANSLAVAKRSAGSFCSAVSTACSTLGGIVSRIRVGAVGFSVITLATIDCTVLPENGGSPTSIS